MSWIEDIISPKTRKWEEFYRNRWQYDRVVRSTHGVNCTGGCSWTIHVKDGIVVWELQQVDYPQFNKEVPPYEPRGCQRGISYSWYLYSPIRVKYPIIRGALIDLYRAAKDENPGDPVAAWASIQEDPAKRHRYQRARGKGGFRRVKWDELEELITAANIYVIKKYGSDRITGFAPIPAKSMLSYASGARYLQLCGGINLSFYDWYCDLPNAFPEIWGEQTDVCESADWYQSKFIVSMGANLGMTRTPDIHFFSEARHNGTKTVVMSPDFSMVAKHADQWIPAHAGSDGAFWMSVTHVILQEYHVNKKTPYFIDYVKRYTDCPFLVELHEEDGKFLPGRMVRANRVAKYKDVSNGDWKFLNYDADSGDLVMPKGSMGHRWDDKKGNWNMKYEDGEFNTPYDPELTLLEKSEKVLQVEFTEFGLDKKALRGVPVKYIDTVDGGKIPVATIYDLTMSQYGVGRGLEGEFPTSYDDKDQAYTPAWQEIFTGIGKKEVIQLAREWASTAETTEGKCMVIVGAAINHWFHNNLMYRSAIMAQMLTGCNGKNGGGMNHYVGQEKLAPMDSWATIMSSKDWGTVPRLQQGPIWHYINSSQWRYDGNQKYYNSAPENELANMHSADWAVKAVRNGWMPYYPQYNKNNFEIVKDAEAAGHTTDEAMRAHIVDQLKSGDLKHSIVEPDEEVNFPRNWFIWKGNAIGTSAKGHEYFLDHYLGTHNNKIADEVAGDIVKDITYKEDGARGKMDLVIDINFRMDTSALYSDIVLPTASWYEKADINSTDMHSFIHPLSEAIPPVWESKTDWQIFQALAKKMSEMAKRYLPKPMKDVVNVPLSHDSADEITQPRLLDWSKGECEPIPGKTMHKIAFVERDYTKVYEKFIALGDNIKKTGLGAHGNSYQCADVYEEMVDQKQGGVVQQLDGETYPSLKSDVEAINAILKLSTLTNGKLTERCYKNMSEKIGVPEIGELGTEYRQIDMEYRDLQSQPKRYNSSPLWSGLMHDGRTYAAYTYNVDMLVPWRTLTGRQHFYLDHDAYIAFGEHLSTYKPSPTPEAYGDLRQTINDGKARMLNCLTPHGKWHIHSTYGDTLRMLTLSRGAEPCWLSEQDAEELGIKDNDHVEVYNDHGTYVTRACVSARIPKGVCLVYHAVERTYNIAKSQERRGPKGQPMRGGMNNSFTRVHLKPNLMCGGYGQFTYHFNYWGPVGVNRDTHVLVRRMDKVEY
ncbi:MAG: nitrate reductase subunit alpha [Crocinitomicaceae bacterium]|nr:nitrate reductase subunit alpha [Crocinitomicaceae bacterium]|tara:strand:- start:23970 stop:27614 length:3645 start_codon:yes stop_codon:yes gene_type:complete